MSTKWHSYREPPGSGRWVMLRFGDNGKRDAIGFYHHGHGCFYKSATSVDYRTSVHPTHWAEIEEDDT